MKRILSLFMCFVLAGCLFGCGSEAAEEEEAVVEVEVAESTEIEEVVEEAVEEATVDYDLTVMSADMVYATVYDMMCNPSNYYGATVKMNGAYYAAYDEEMADYYFYCIIADAASCCSQGMEFEWGDGSHVYPDEYPEEAAEVYVTGTFETYTVGENTYCHLANSTMEIA